MARATRRMKVRWPRRVGCGHYVLTGTVIIGRPGHWSCRDCAIAALTTPIATPAPEERS